MTFAAADPTSNPESASPVAPAHGWVSLAAVCVCGVAAVFVSQAALPTQRGPAALSGATSLLAVFDTVWALCLVWPGSRSLSARIGAAFVGLPFHVSLAAVVGASTGHAVALGLLLCGWGGAVGLRGVGATRTARGSLSDRVADRTWVAVAAALACGAPAAGYVFGDFLGVGSNALLWSSPLTAPALLAYTAESAASADGVPALASAALLVALHSWFDRRRVGPA